MHAQYIPRAYKNCFANCVYHFLCCDYNCYRSNSNTLLQCLMLYNDFKYRYAVNGHFIVEIFFRFSNDGSKTRFVF